jgi:hypothetical protein
MVMNLDTRCKRARRLPVIPSNALPRVEASGPKSTRPIRSRRAGCCESMGAIRFTGSYIGVLVWQLVTLEGGVLRALSRYLG